MLITGNGAFNPTESELSLLLIVSQVGLIAATVLAVYLLIRMYRLGKLPTQRISQLHGDESGATATLEFMLVITPLLYIVLAVIQLSMMLNAQVHVGYAAYAAARSVSTVGFMDLPDEPEGQMLAKGEENATKWTRVERAARPGTIALSPGNASKALSVYSYIQARRIGANPEEINSLGNGGPDVLALPGQLSLMAAHRGTEVLQGNRLERAAVKATYASVATRVLIDGAGSSDDVSLSNDRVEVTVEYDFWLSIPYAGVTMRQAFAGEGFFDDYPTLTMRQSVTVPAWPKVSALDG
ncbi:MAG: TadE/TadG family type IV pilus assembly protein [Halioglobus sp.]